MSTSSMTQDNTWLRFEQGSKAELELFLHSAVPNRPVRVILAEEHWGARACSLLAGARSGMDLQVLMLRGTAIGDDGIEVLAHSTVLASLRCLGVERCGLTDRGIQILAQSPHLSNLRELYLCNRAGIETGLLNVIGDTGAMALAASLQLGHLEKLDLWNTGVGDHGFAAIVASPHLSRLSSVTAWGTRLTREGAQRFREVATERWENSKDKGQGVAYCWIYTDYDERAAE